MTKRSTSTRPPSRLVREAKDFISDVTSDSREAFDTYIRQIEEIVRREQRSGPRPDVPPEDWCGDIEFVAEDTPAWARILTIQLEASALYNELVALAGPSKARETWLGMGRLQRRGPQVGSRDPRSDALLLRLYQEFARANPVAASGALPRLVAAHLHDPNPKSARYTIFGQSTKSALEKRLRKLLKQHGKGGRRDRNSPI